MSSPPTATASLTSPRRPTPAPAALVVLLLGSTLTVMAGAVLTPVVAVLRDEFALSGTGAGLVLTMHALSLAMASPLAGVLVDRYGARTPLAVGLLVYGFAGGAGALATSYLALLATRVVFGVGAAAVFTATTVALLHSGSGPSQDRVMGWRGTATSIGGVAWPLVGGAAAIVAWQAPFAVYLLGVPLAIATWMLIPPRRVPPRRAGDQASTGSGTGTADGDTSGGLKLLRLLGRRPAILAYCGLLGLGTALLYVVLVFVPLRLAEIGVAAPLAIGALTGLMSTAMSLSGLSFARLSARIGTARLLPGAYGAITVSFALLAAGGHPALLATAAALFGAATGLTVPALTVLLGRSSPTAVHGRVMALSGTAIFLGQFLSPLLLGPVIDSTSTSTGFAVATGAAAVTTVLLLLRTPENRQ